MVGAHFADFGGNERQTLLADAPESSLETQEHVTVGGFLALSFRDRWDLKLEVLFATKGAHAVDNLVLPNPDAPDSGCSSNPPDEGCTILVPYELDHILRYIEVPILLQYNLEYDGVIVPHIFVGPTLAFLLDTELKGDGQIVQGSGMQTGTVALSGDIDDVSRSIQIAVVAGAGVEFPLPYGSLVLNIRYEQAIRRAMNGQFDVSATVNGEPMLPTDTVPVRSESLRNRGFSLMAAFVF